MVKALARLFKQGPANSPVHSPAPETPLAETGFVVFDTELTGLDYARDEIVSIGALQMDGARIKVGAPFYRIVNPACEMSGESIAVHGILPSETAGKPGIETAIAEFREFAGQDVLVGYCVSIDLHFLNKPARRTADGGFANPAVDVLSVLGWLKGRGAGPASWMHLKPGTSLFEIARRFGIEPKGEHDALMDAYVTAQLFQQLVPLLADRGVMTLGELVGIGHPSKGGEMRETKSLICNF